MSRGPGRWQRMILDAVADGGPVGLTHPDQTRAEQSAIRRAAHVLEAAGRIALTSHRVEGTPRLVAYPLGADVPAARIVTGLDGKTYRLPA